MYVLNSTRLSYSCEHMYIYRLHLVEVYVCVCLSVCLSVWWLENYCRYLLSAWWLLRLEINLGWVRMSRSQVKVKVIFRRVRGHLVRLWVNLWRVVSFRRQWLCFLVCINLSHFSKSLIIFQQDVNIFFEMECILKRKTEAVVVIDF